MANRDTTLREWIERFNKYEFHVPSTDVQIQAGWYDWFCSDSALVGKTKKLGPKVIQIAESKKVDKDKMYVFFKNNCPCDGPLYDDFRICSLKDDGEVVYNITPRSGHTKKAEVWGKENDFKAPLAQGTWNDVRKFFGV